MQLSKKHWSNIIFFAALALILFTPVGTFIKVQLGKIKVLVSNPTAIDEENRETLTTFDWKLVDENGKHVNFNKMKGDVILVNFWATWCPPCIAEMPNLNALYVDYEDKISFVFVANDKLENVNAYMEKNHYDFPVYFASEKAPNELYSNSIPATFLLNDRGDIVMKEIGSSNWNSQNVRNLIDELLAFTYAE